MVVPTQPVPEFGSEIGDVVLALRYGLMIVGKLELDDHTMLALEKIFAPARWNSHIRTKRSSYRAVIRSLFLRNRTRQWSSVSA